MTLPFEGFLEALVRLSALKALPTDMEIADAECVDAAAFFTKLRGDNEERYQALLSERYTPWGHEPLQPIWRCVAHLCWIIVRKIEVDSGGVPSSAKVVELSAQQTTQWVTRFVKSRT